MSKIVLFCRRHALSPSVKAGGYGTAGWAVNGDIIVDLSKLVEVDIEVPHEDGSFTSLKDVAPANSKGKQPVAFSRTVNSGKRRREHDIELRRYNLASQAVASFLNEPSSASAATLPTPRAEGPSPNVRRRIEESDLSSSYSTATSGTHAVRQVSIESGSNSPSASSDYDSGNISNRSTTATSPSPPHSGQITALSNINYSSTAPSTALPVRRADPFGYLNPSAPSSSSIPPPTVMQSATPASMFRSWGAIANLAQMPTQMQELQARAEPVHPHAFVTFGAGMRQKELDTYTAQHKLEARYATGAVTGAGDAVADGIPYHVPFSAHPVGSSIMLLGGFGFLGRLHGLSIDNLVEVEMVLADGRIVVVNEGEYPDLWWALRGAGPTLGIATRYKARAYPVPVVFAGNLIYRFNRATAPSLIKHFRDCVKGAPRELYANVLLTAGPAGKDSLVVVQMCYVGTKEKGQEYLAAISSWDGERCLLNEVDEKSFLHQQDSVAQVLRGKAGRQWFIRSALITSLPDDLINETVLQFADTPVGCTWLFEIAGGAIADFEDTCVPKSQREAPFTIAALHQWEMDVDDDRCIDSAEEWIAGTLESVHQGGPFPSFLGRREPPERVKSCFGDNWSRLCEIKQMYDPDNLFRNTFWPLNAEGEMVEASTHEPATPKI